jgi:tetratricopeptide (TPR) repeat protein
MSNKKSKLKTESSPKPPPAPDLRPAVPADVPGKRLFYAGALFTLLVSCIVYVKTMAASASFWDAGEFIATSFTLGVPHSPGTPLYILVGRVFTLLPLPLATAVKVNLLSAVCGALGSLFAYLLVVRFLDYMIGKSAVFADTVIKVAAATAAALFLTFSDTYWFNATEAEVYAMSAFLMGFMTWLGLKWADDPFNPKSTSLIFLLFYLLALSVGFHLGTILAFSGIFFVILMTRKKPFSNFEFLVACLGVGILVADATLYRQGGVTIFLYTVFVGLLLWLYLKKSSFAIVCTALFILGVSVHIVLMIRSGHNPAIDEGDPETWRSLYAVLRREQYPAMNVFVRKTGYGFQFQHFIDYFQAQFEMMTLSLGKLNLGSVIPLGLGLWGIIDQYTKHKKTFIMLFVTFLVTSVGLIVFLNFSDHEVRNRDYFYSPAFYYFAIFIGLGMGSLLYEVRKFSRRSMGSNMPAFALAALFFLLPWTTGFHYYFNHDRSSNYVCRAYSINMLKPLEKDAIIFTNGDNDTFPLWYIQEVENFRKDVRVVNLSLLNTPWYIKQLRDNEPRVPISWNDQYINGLGWVRTPDGGVLLVRDIAVQHILQENRWKRPVYFAVTIPPETFAPYKDYLDMEGLVYKLIPKKGENMINLQMLEENIFNVYSYQSILTDDWKRDSSLHLFPHIEHLIQNYAAAFCTLAFAKHRASDTPEAVRCLEIAKEISPNVDPVVLLLGWYYVESGQTDKAIQEYKEQIARHPERLELLYRLAGVYERSGDMHNALLLLEELIQKNPRDRDVVLSAVGIAIKLNLAQRARSYLVDWLSKNPGDADMRSALEELDKAVSVK